MRAALVSIVTLALAGCAHRAAPPGPATAASTAPPPTTATPPTIASTEAAAAPAGSPPAADDVPSSPPTHLGPLDARQKAIFFGSPEDQPTEHRGGVTRGREGKQYLAGNEKVLHAFYPAVENLGGGYVGVGSDQAYLFLGWARPELAWLVDYDPDVVAIHGVYRAFFLAASTPAEMIALWDRESREAGLAAIAEHADGAEAKLQKRLYLRYRGWIHRRLDALARRLAEVEVPSYLTDQDTYDFIRELLLAQRVRPMLANLVESRGIAGIAKAAEELQVPIRLLYLSNAEEYWRSYPARFRANIDALPGDEHSIVLRTLLIWDVNEDYRYNIQSLANFRKWLDEPYVRTVYDITHGRPAADPVGINLFETTTDPQASPAARRAAAAAEP